MAFAWSLFFASKWTQKRLEPDWDTNTMQPRLILAVTLSGLTVVTILILDLIIDMPETEDAMDEALKKIIMGFALLVGFAWEQSFEGATHALASRTQYPVMMKVAFAFAVCILVVPAWRWYILVNVEHAKEPYYEGARLKRMTRAGGRLDSVLRADLVGPDGRTRSRELADHSRGNPLTKVWKSGFGHKVIAPSGSPRDKVITPREKLDRGKATDN